MRVVVTTAAHLVASSSADPTLVASVAAVTPVMNVEYVHVFLEASLDERGMHRIHRDIVAVIDTQTLSITKSTVDSFVVSDIVSAEFAKTLDDFFSVTDALILRTEFFRVFEEGFTVADVSALGIHKPLLDGVVVSDVRITEVTKLLKDGFSMNDSFGLSDSATSGYVKSVNNIVIFEDEVAASCDKTIQADAFAISDGGIVSLNTYSDPSYFAEDYLGITRYF